MLPGAAARVVPARSELAAAPDIGGYAGAATLEPELADRRVVVWQHRDPEPAVAGEMNGRIAGLLCGPDLDVGNAFSVYGHRLVARDDDPIRRKCARGPL